MTDKVKYKHAWIWTLLFGGWYYLYHENWRWFFCVTILGALTYGLSSIVVSFYAKRIMISHDERLLKRQSNE